MEFFLEAASLTRTTVNRDALFAELKKQGVHVISTFDGKDDRLCLTVEAKDVRHIERACTVATVNLGYYFTVNYYTQRKRIMGGPVHFYDRDRPIHKQALVISAVEYLHQFVLGH